jgi:hypothetical protein
MARKALFIVLALTLITAAPALAQKKPSSKAAVASDDASSATAAPKPLSFGQRWNAMSDKEHDAFLLGMLAAIQNRCQTLVANSQTTDIKEANKTAVNCLGSLFPYAPALVKQAMSELYQNKANNSISFDYMYGVALLKIKGTPVEDNLVKLRQASEKAIKSMK